MNRTGVRIGRVGPLFPWTLSSPKNAVLRVQRASRKRTHIDVSGQFPRAQRKRRGDSRLGARCKLPDQRCSLSEFRLPDKDSNNPIIPRELRVSRSVGCTFEDKSCTFGGPSDATLDPEVAEFRRQFDAPDAGDPGELLAIVKQLFDGWGSLDANGRATIRQVVGYVTCDPR